MRALPVLFLLLTAFALGATCSSSGSDHPAGTGGRIGNSGLYIALGDSLSFGVGASDAKTTSFVGRVHESLGPAIELLNLGVPGATSDDLLSNGTLDRALSEITQRDGDTDPANDVQLVTLEIGGNDLLALYGSFVLTGICPDVETGFQKPECVQPLQTTLGHYRPNLTTILDRLAAADPAVPIVLLTLYNPFGHVPKFGEIGDLSIEGLPDTPFPEGINDIMRAVAAGRSDVTVVDVYGPFHGHTPDFIFADGIHPNDAGYAAMADAVTSAIAKLRAN